MKNPPKRKPPEEKTEKLPGITLDLDQGARIVLRPGSVEITQRRVTQHVLHGDLGDVPLDTMLFDFEVGGLPRPVVRQLLIEFIYQAGLSGPFKTFLEGRLVILKPEISV